MSMKFKGLGTALVTPFKNGKVDENAYRATVARQIEAGVDFLVPLGSTAETPCLSDDEKVRLVQITREMAPGVPMVAGVGSNSLTGTVRNMRLLDSLDVQAYLVVVPFYNKPTQEGLYKYFKAVAQETDRDVILYNVPGRTGTNMKAETTLRLAHDVPNVVAVKEASGDVAQIVDIKRQAPEGFTVLSGNDDQTLPLMASGIDGVISVASNVAPKMMKELVDAVFAGDLQKAICLNDKLMPLYNALFVESNPIPAKAALKLLGLCEDEMRLPLTPAVGSTEKLLKEVMSGLGLL